MPKRFTDTEKWKKPFIRSLQAPYKLLWFYILDDCNHAGIWDVDIEVACIKIGEKITVEDALKNFGERVKVISKSQWFLPDFISFQYGELNEKNRLHISVIQILSRYKLFPIKPLVSPLNGAKDKDKDKEKEKDKEQDKDKESAIIFPFNSEQFLSAWEGWKEYKKLQHRFTFKGSEQAALKQLSELSHNDEVTAIKIIQQSISNGWKGLFEIKNSGNEQSTGKNGKLSMDKLKEAHAKRYGTGQQAGN